MDFADPMQPKRIAWLINHTTLREFEAPLIRSLGYEVYTPKQLLATAGWRSGSADYADDLRCTLPPKELEILNRHNFYEHEFSPEVSRILNRRFGTVICGAYVETMLRELAAHFRGRILLRSFGLESPNDYSRLIRVAGGQDLWRRLREISSRFWFAPCYESIPLIEEPLLKERSITLPLGMSERVMKHENTWSGGDSRLLFFCPLIRSGCPYYETIYAEFKKAFGRLPHLIGGQQTVRVDDPNVAGFVTSETIENWMRTFAVMYYHSREPRHLHYHPLEAIVFGMPVIFMRGGLMDALGGPDQPGACDTVAEAKRKVVRILGGDSAFVDDVRARQRRILETFSWTHNRTEWQRLFVEGVMREPIAEAPIDAVASERFRIAVFLPQPHRGGKLRVAKDLAKMIQEGSRRRGTEVDVVFAAPKGEYDVDREFADLGEIGIQVRALEWKRIGADALAIANASALGASREVRRGQYLQPVDGVNDFMDCDFWLFVSDRMAVPPAPLRPYGALLFDYVQRHVPEALSVDGYVVQAEGMIPFAQEAKFVMVTTPAAKADANSYAGVPLRRIIQIPLFFELPKAVESPRILEADYLVWVANASPHKNSTRVLRALEKYYDDFAGNLKSMVIGAFSHAFAENGPECLQRHLPSAIEARAFIRASRSLKRNLRIEGELSPSAHAAAIKHASFLLHGNLNDNGSFAVIDAAALGVPSLSSRYPAMEFLDKTCALNLTFFDPHDIDDMARSLKAMEATRDQVKLPSREFLETFGWRDCAEAVFDVIGPQLELCAKKAYR